MLYLPGYKSSDLTAVTVPECSWLQSVVWEWSGVDAQYLGAVEDNSGAVESARSLCGGSDPASAPAVLLDSSWRFLSQKACSPESSPRSESSYTGEQAWTGTSPAERERRKKEQKEMFWLLNHGSGALCFSLKRLCIDAQNTIIGLYNTATKFGVWTNIQITHNSAREVCFTLFSLYWLHAQATGWLVIAKT